MVNITLQAPGLIINHELQRILFFFMAYEHALIAFEPSWFWSQGGPLCDLVHYSLGSFFPLSFQLAGQLKRDDSVIAWQEGG